MSAMHPDDDLQDYLDGRVSATRAAEIRAHLDTCEACRLVSDELMMARDAAATLRVDGPMPADLLASVQRALDAESGSTPAPSRVATTGQWRLWAVAATAAVLVAYMAFGRPAASLDLPAQAARDLADVSTRALPLARRTSDAAALERYFAEGPDGLRVRVIDLGMMGIPLEGGVRHVFGGAPSALYSYRTSTGARLACQMYIGRLEDLPPPDQARDDRGFHFQIYARGAVTVVFWQEGSLVCVLASDLPAGDVIALALAKAMATRT